VKSKNLFFCGICLLILACSSAQTIDLSVMTFNIRYDNPADMEYSWVNRKEMVFTVLEKYKPEIIGFQEALKGQVGQINEFLKGYKCTGVGRDDGKEKGEYSVIFYDSSRFVQKGGSTFWLSETPDIPGSISWNSACTRIVTWARLFDKKAGRYLFVFNTHFDHISEIARFESAKLLLTKIKQIAAQETVILTGDFNSSDTSSAYSVLTNPHSEFPMDDTRKLAGKNSLGPPYSFIGFPFNPGNEIIDFIFISRNRGLKVTRNSIIDFHRDYKYPSDHLPVMAKFKYVTKN
jgi:endonuclease/exonuclease/phosphatase family metal-dependent hydrolase